MCYCFYKTMKSIVLMSTLGEEAAHCYILYIRMCMPGIKCANKAKSKDLQLLHITAKSSL